MATPQQIASQAGSANTAYQMQAARQAYGRKRKQNQQQQLVQQENRVRKTELTGRARRKKGGNYTSYGQTGGALAPNALAADRAQVGNSHGVAIVRGDGVFGGSHSLQNDLYAPSGARRKKNGSNGKGGLYVAPRKKGRRRGRPQYTNGGIFSTNV